MTLNRRQFSALLAAGGAAGVLGMPNVARAAKPRVVVIGGGAGGATAARYLAKDSAGAIDVTLIEATKRYYTCFFSNLYLGGFRDYASIGHGYGGLAVNHGVNVVHDWAENVDRAARTVNLASGASIPYDHLVISPGIDMKYDSVPGYSVEAQTPDAACVEIRHPDRGAEGADRGDARRRNLRHGASAEPVPVPSWPL